MPELKLKWELDGSYFKIEIDGNGLISIEAFHPDYAEEPVPTLIDCGQAKQLMQFLQEHLK